MPVSAAVFTALVCVLFGSNPVAIKFSLTGLGPFTTAGLRFGMAAVAVAVWARVTGRDFALKPGQLRQLMVISILFSAQLSMFYLGLNHTTASRGTLIANFQPFLTLLFAHFFLPDERMTLRRVLGMSLGFIGVAVLFLDKQTAGANMRLGDICIFMTVVLWAASAVYTKRIISEFQPFHLVVYPMLMALPVFWLNAWFWDGRMFGTITPQVVGQASFTRGLVDRNPSGLWHGTVFLKTLWHGDPAFLPFHHARVRGDIGRLAAGEDPIFRPYSDFHAPLSPWVSFVVYRIPQKKAHPHLPPEPEHLKGSIKNKTAGSSSPARFYFYRQ